MLSFDRLTVKAGEALQGAAQEARRAGDLRVLEESLRTLVELQLRRVEALVTELGMNLSVGEDVKDALAREGFDPAFGARPLKRAIQRGIQDPLAMYLLEEEVEDGSTIRVSLMPGDALQVQFEHTHEGVEEGLLQPA